MHSRKPLALVLEDDETAGEALALVLEDWGADVVLIADPATALAADDVRLSQARWIITDYQLGGAANGVTIAGQLAADAPSGRAGRARRRVRGHEQTRPRRGDPGLAGARLI